MPMSICSTVLQCSRQDGLLDLGALWLQQGAHHLHGEGGGDDEEEGVGDARGREAVAGTIFTNF